jgi:cell division protein FtsQ
MIQGDVNIKKVNIFLNLLKKTSLDLSEIKFLKFFPSGRWDIIFNNDRIIKLPRKDVLKLLTKVELLLKDQNFNTKIIDLRINNKIILSDE